MSDSFLDNLPSNERRKLKQMMSPAAYEKLREKVKGPEDLKEELKRGETLAELKFGLETQPGLPQKLKSAVDKDVKEQGVENVFEAGDASPDAKKNLEKGNFKLAVSSHPTTHQDHLMAVPEGNVQEKIPVQQQLSDKYASQLLQGQGNA